MAWSPARRANARRFEVHHPGDYATLNSNQSRDSTKLSPQALLDTARAHWQIENALHWQLDVSFGEDAARNRKDNAPANIAVLRRRALDVARLDQSKGSLTTKLKRAGWNDAFLLKLLGHMR